MRLIDFVYHSTLGFRVIRTKKKKKKKKKGAEDAGAALDLFEEESEHDRARHLHSAQFKNNYLAEM